MGDIFGISTAIEACCEIYFRGSRRSGRTIAMIEILKDGDRVVFANAKEAMRVKKLAAERGKQIIIDVISPTSPGMIHERRAPGRTILDHSWVEEYYKRSIQRTSNDIINLQLMGMAEYHEEPNPEIKRRSDDLWRGA